MRARFVIPMAALVLASCSQLDTGPLHTQIQETAGAIPYASVGVIRCSGDDAQVLCMGCTVSAYEPGDLENRVFAEVQEYNFRAEGEGGALDLTSYGGMHGRERLQHDGTLSSVRAAIEAGTQWCEAQGARDWYVVSDNLIEASYVDPEGESN
ncbi:hypothetical protein [Hyphobacterium sp.]|uniref:hypothetical protein n=1 Tax=Hyphobacterium sp. TaxID=2004662 RepID=UPI003BA8A359